MKKDLKKIQKEVNEGLRRDGGKNMKELNRINQNTMNQPSMAVPNPTKPKPRGQLYKNSHPLKVATQGSQDHNTLLHKQPRSKFSASVVTVPTFLNNTIAPSTRQKMIRNLQATMKINTHVNRMLGTLSPGARANPTSPSPTLQRRVDFENGSPSNSSLGSGVKDPRKRQKRHILQASTP